MERLQASQVPCAIENSSGPRIMCFTGLVHLMFEYGGESTYRMIPPGTNEPQGHSPRGHPIKGCRNSLTYSFPTMAYIRPHQPIFSTWHQIILMNWCCIKYPSCQLLFIAFPCWYYPHLVFIQGQPIVLPYYLFIRQQGRFDQLTQWLSEYILQIS